jgi:hypothetical protein
MIISKSKLPHFFKNFFITEVLHTGFKIKSQSLGLEYFLIRRLYKYKKLKFNSVRGNIKLLRFFIIVKKSKLMGIKKLTFKKNLFIASDFNKNLTYTKTSTHTNFNVWSFSVNSNTQRFLTSFSDECYITHTVRFTKNVFLKKFILFKDLISLKNCIKHRTLFIGATVKFKT